LICGIITSVKMKMKKRDDMNDEEWYQRFGFVPTWVDVNIHMCENEVESRSSIHDGDYEITLENQGTEFGVEEEKPKKGRPRMVVIQFGFGGLSVPKEDFEKALMHYRLHSVGIDEIKKQLKKKEK